MGCVVGRDSTETRGREYCRVMIRSTGDALVVFLRTMLTLIFQGKCQLAGGYLRTNVIEPPCEPHQSYVTYTYYSRYVMVNAFIDSTADSALLNSGKQ